MLPLDVTDGAIHAMYRARTPLHGRFIYDLHFYHHARDPYIWSLRRELLRTFRDDPPDYVLSVDSWRPRGPGAADFPDLEELLAREYTIVLRTQHAQVLRRKSP